MALQLVSIKLFKFIRINFESEFWSYFLSSFSLTCEKCYDRLANTANTCFFKNGMVLCKNDYIK